MLAGLRERVEYWVDVISFLAWKWLVLVPLALLGAFQAVREEFLSPQQQQHLLLLKWLPNWRVEWWALAVLVLFLAFAMEGAYRVSGRGSAPTENAAVAFAKIASQSRWAMRAAKNWKNLPALMYEAGLEESVVIAGRLREALSREIHNELRKGHILALGTGGATDTEREILKEEWDNIALDFSERKLGSTTMSGGPPNVCAWKATKDIRDGNRIVYTQVRFLRDGLYGRFPLTWRPRKAARAEGNMADPALPTGR